MRLIKFDEPLFTKSEEKEKKCVSLKSTKRIYTLYIVTLALYLKFIYDNMLNICVIRAICIRCRRKIFYYL